ncbi:adiponectin receptor protein-like [Brevipalpus obovatus]|uniref:adiponectin receptor protein-like n=1 Tax=Brevipalpus obovatus TaxID=246614 RepID=UPI003D9F8FE2
MPLIGENDATNSPETIHNSNQSDKLGELMSFEQMPPWLHDNPFILTGYRAINKNYHVYIKSIFIFHNETLNIWSHMIASLYFFRLIGEIGESRGPFCRIKNRAPMLAFLLSAFLGFGISAVYHTWSPLSERARTLLVKLDYVGITNLVTNGFVAWIYYSFSNSEIQSIYLSSIMIGGLIMTIISQVETFNDQDSRHIRAGTFVFFGSAALAPACYLIYKSWTEEKMAMIVQELTLTIMVFILAIIIYTSRFPESFFPGKFDYFGSSHSLFHWLVIVAILHHYKALVNIAKKSKQRGDSIFWPN